ncbi:MAG TPA: single-stranded-DNA-specific exonuclease RecJ [Anaerolineales bacterium]|nr:single-stranded-DNA-specific exonuclease RecJ [Anaerolineales bacterium]
MTSRERQWVLAGDGSAGEEWEGFSATETALLRARGLRSAAEAEVFLNPREGRTHSPWNLTGMEPAVDRIQRAINSLEPIAVYGDYDADGLSAAALLYGVLLRLGADVQVYIPNRFDEGYGLHASSLERLAAAGRRLVITVDCGVRASAEAEVARDLGLSLIVTDHHEPGPTLPRAEVVINPRQSGDTYPDKNLAGVGVAYKLAEALCERAGGRVPESLKGLVAVGTIADMVPLIGENRTLAAQGMRALNEGPPVGLGALTRVSRVPAGRLRARDIAFGLAPRLNAAGRMGAPESALRLLITEDGYEAEHLAMELEMANRSRQQQTGEATNAAKELLGEQITTLALLFASETSFSEGIIGLVAAKLTEEFYRPAVVVSRGDEFSKGSARSVAGFDITRALDACAELLERHGGHSSAAGFAIRTERLDDLRARLAAMAGPIMDGEHGTPVLRIDAQLSFGEIDGRLWKFIQRLEPCGSGNPEPLFMSQGVTVAHQKAVGGGGEHLKLRLEQDGKFRSGIAFRRGSMAGRVPRRVDVAYRLQKNDYWGTPELELAVEAVRPAQGEDPQVRPTSASSR